MYYRLQVAVRYKCFSLEASNRLLETRKVGMIVARCVEFEHWAASKLESTAAHIEVVYRVELEASRNVRTRGDDGDCLMLEYMSWSALCRSAAQPYISDIAVAADSSGHDSSALLRARQSVGIPPLLGGDDDCSTESPTDAAAVHNCSLDQIPKVRHPFALWQHCWPHTTQRHNQIQLKPVNIKTFKLIFLNHKLMTHIYLHR